MELKEIETTLLNNLLGLYKVKFPTKWEEKFAEKAQEMVDESEVSKEAFDQVMDENDIMKPKLTYDRKKHKLKITEPKKTSSSSSSYGDGCGGSSRTSRGGC